MYLNVYKAFCNAYPQCTFGDLISRRRVEIPTIIMTNIKDRDSRDASCIISVKALEYNHVSMNLSDHDAVELSKVVIDYGLLFQKILDPQAITNILGVGYGLNKMIH